MTYSAEVLADSPIAYYRLGDASGTTMTDSSGNGRNGTYVNSPTLGVTGLLVGDADTAVSFASASTQSASVTDDNAYDGISAFTVEAWIKPSTVSSTPIIVNRDGGTNRAWQFRLNAGKVEFLKIAGGTVTAASSTTLTTGVIRHVAAVYNGTDIRIYIDGALDGTPAAATGTLGTVARDVEIAGRIGGQLFNGVIDEVATYASALTSTRIAAHFTAGSTLPPGAATGTGSLTLNGAGTGSGNGAGMGALVLSGAGSAQLAAAGTGSLSLGATGSSGFIASGSAVLVLTTAGTAAPLYITDTSNAFDGLDLTFTGTAAVTRPPATVPTTLVAAAKVDKAVAYPVPTMVNGRPT